MRSILCALSTGGCVALCFFLLLGWLQGLHPAFDSFSHFRLHFAGLLLTSATVCFLLGKKRWAFLSGIAVAISLWLSAPYLPGMDQYSPEIKRNTLRVVQMNLRFNNDEVDRAITALKSANADIMLLQELTRVNERIMPAFKATHPYQLSCHSYGVGSVAILSRYEFSQSSTGKCARFFGFATAQIVKDGQTIILASFHSRWPWPARQKDQVDRLHAGFAGLKHPLILAGDFNAAPWSAVVQRIANLTKTQVAPGLKLTWAPRFAEFKTRIGALLPIDQILVSPDFHINDRRVLQDGGSDHFSHCNDTQFLSLQVVFHMPAFTRANEGLGWIEYGVLH